jgi:Family of unknown function (DUF6093)
MVTINRAPGKALIEQMMVDTVSVTRPARGPGAKVLNEATGRMEVAVAASSIYTGYAIIASIRNKDKEITIGQAPKDLNGYEMLLPRTSTSAKTLTGDPNAILPGDIVEVTAAGENPGMVGNTLKVVQVENSTHPLYRRVTIRQETDSPGNPEF